MILAGLPQATQYGGMSFVTTELAPIMLPSPMVTPGRTVTFSPSQTFLHILIGPFEINGLAKGGGNQRVSIDFSMRMVADIYKRCNQDIIFNYDRIDCADVAVGLNIDIVPNYDFRIENLPVPI